MDVRGHSEETVDNDGNKFMNIYVPEVGGWGWYPGGKALEDVIR